MSSVPSPSLHFTFCQMGMILLLPSSVVLNLGQVCSQFGSSFQLFGLSNGEEELLAANGSRSGMLPASYEAPDSPSHRQLVHANGPEAENAVLGRKGG